ncbi:MAG TPA: Sec-dependent nitrous-oxide reductase [Acidimicrobiia bacterium]|nr:Sec-dependent nitrous-oxide reductase [Acidimicrobiia bacterium]
MKNRGLNIGLVLLLGAALGVGVSRIGGSSSSGGRLGDIASDHGLSGAEAEAALATFTAPGEHDEYMMFASGGHSGQMHVIGVPSMQLLKTIPVFSNDAWSGYGYGGDAGEKILAAGSDATKNDPLRWGDAHHPALSETGGDYDGRWLYINDRANGRMGMIDLRDFKTKQILDIPNIGSSHGGMFATPNTDYVHISSKTPAPLWGPADLSKYQEIYRGVSTFVNVNQETGQGDLQKSFQIELPPYNQDLADAGKKTSDGFAFINTYNTEMAIGGNSEGGESLEIGATKNDFDFLNIIDYRKAEEVVKAGKVEEVGGMRMIRLQTAIDEGILHFAPEPRNPHGVDVNPTGDYITVAGKLDPSTYVYDIDLIKKAIAGKTYSGKDPFGVPILDLDKVLAGKVEVGAGPLHTQYDAEGNAYTSLFVESAVAKWTLGPKAGIASGDAFKMVDKVAVHYNIGHLVTAEGDTVSPDGKYLVALNKWSVDRHPKVGTLHPQNFQLIDLDSSKMRILKDMPIGFGEPHYVQMIKRDKLEKTWETYPAGTDPFTMEVSEKATEPGKERVERDGKNVHLYMTAMRSHFTPDIVRVKQGDHVIMHVTNIETAKDATHGFAIPGHNIQASLDPGEVVTVEFDAQRTGSFGFYCTEFCSALHLEMQGWLLVEPV